MSLKKSVSDGYFKTICSILFIFFAGIAKAEISMMAIEGHNEHIVNDSVFARGKVSCPQPHAGFKIWFNDSGGLRNRGDIGTAYNESMANSIGISLVFDSALNPQVSPENVVIMSPSDVVFFEVKANEDAKLPPGAYIISVSAECLD
ncbi:hypothetical protein [Aeromonas sp. R9-2]|uniref:hypothetical protein n=1 Tax=Aeromonas sp. R9-2 TaxID=3138479 RepID=UPI0034A1C9AD